MSGTVSMAVSVLLCLVLSGTAGAQVREVWVERYNGPANSTDEAYAIALDPNGNIAVTGASWGGADNHYDYATVKYSPTGARLWVARYNGPGSSNDQAFAIAADETGNFYVTGRSDGAPGGASHTDYATVKYDADGVERWVARYDGPANSTDEAYAIALDGVGNVYVTGRSRGNGTDYDYATVKYDFKGVEQWAARYNGPADSTDEAAALAVDGDGNLYVTGRSRGVGTDFDYATVKYGPDGSELWVRRYNGPGNGADRAVAIALDPEGNVYVTGSSVGDGTGADYATIKYSPGGDELWVRRYNNPEFNGPDRASAIAVDEAGNAYVTGGSAGHIHQHTDYLTVKYSPEGEELWVARFHGPRADRGDFANAVALDPEGNVYVTGRSFGTYIRADYLTIKYDADGNELWVARHQAVGESQDEPRAIAVDPDGNAYVTGMSWAQHGSLVNRDYKTIRYSPEVGVETGERRTLHAGFRISPNPLTGGRATLRLEGLGRNPESRKDSGHIPRLIVAVYDVSGRPVYQESAIYNGQSAMTLELRDLSSGVYLVRLSAAGTAMTGRLVVGR